MHYQLNKGSEISRVDKICMRNDECRCGDARNVSATNFLCLYLHWAAAGMALQLLVLHGMTADARADLWNCVCAVPPVRVARGVHVCVCSAGCVR